MTEQNHNNEPHYDFASSLLPAILIIVALFIILFVTLNPFDFQFRRLTISEYLSAYDLPPSSAIDFPQNILLFLPFGFGIAAVLERRSWSKNHIQLAVLISGFLLTLLVESLQQFLSTRQPSVADLIANTLGALAGLACYRLWQSNRVSMQRLGRTITVPRNVMAALAVYVPILLLMAYRLSTSTHFQEWDPEFSMLVGNEQTADRPWQGSLGDLLIFDRVLGEREAHDLLENPRLALSGREDLLAYYPLGGDRATADLSGNQPDLVWQPSSAGGSDDPSRNLDGDNWLESLTAVSNLTQRLLETSQLSLRLSVSTGDLEQGGPARIVSISEDPYLRNLTLGQEENDLVLRYRSRLTGENGIRPQFSFPAFFTSSDSTNFVVTVDCLNILLFDARSDTVRSLRLVPGVAFYYKYLHPIFGGESALGQVRVTPFSNWAYGLLFYAVVLLPIAMIMALPSVQTWPGRRRLMLLLVGLLVIPILLEFALALGCSHSPRLLDIFTSIFVEFVVFAALRPFLYHLLDYSGSDR